MAMGTGSRLLPGHIESPTLPTPQPASEKVRYSCTKFRS